MLASLESQKRFLFLGCEVLFREVCLLTATCPHAVDHRWLSQGLHDLGSERMAERLQQEIEAIPEGRYDAILLGFALCNNGVLGLTSAHTPLVIPRAHDCITFFLGSRSNYKACFDANPGSYFMTPGWIERDEVNLEDMSDSIQDTLGLGMSREQMVELYGEENADFLMAEMGSLTQNYSKMIYIDTGVDPQGLFAQHAEAQAREKGWEYLAVAGDLSLLQRLLAGTWDEDFLQVPPGKSIQVTHDESILCTACSGSCTS
ncbi:MAG: DUF1638 domain-containing protein [Planctomycetota bacterium]|jgi:hypothetical protein